MKNLKVWQKLTLMVLVFLLPFAAVTARLVSSFKTVNLEPAQSEHLGLVYLAPVRELLRDVVVHRTLAQAVLSGAAGYKTQLATKETEIRDDINAVDAKEKELGDKLESHDSWTQAKTSCQALLNNESANTNPQHSFTSHNAAIVDVEHLIRQVGDTSTLSLDPELKAFYLMYIDVFRGPELLDVVGQAHAISMRCAVQKKIDEESRRQLAGTVARMGDLISDVNLSIDKAFAREASEAQGTGDHALRTRIDAVRKESIASLTTFLQTTDTLSKATVVTWSPDTYYDSSAKATEDTDKLSEAVTPSLDDMLQERIAGFKRDIAMMLLSAALGLLFVIVVGGFLIRDITRPLYQTVSIAERIAAGDLSVQLSPDHRSDELGMLSHTFNRMIVSLQDISGVADQISAGNLNTSVKPQSEQDRLGNSLAQMVDNLRDMTRNLTQTVNSLGSASNEILASTSQLTSSAAETATAVAETSTTVEEVRQTAHVSNQKAQYVAQTAQHAAQISQVGKQATDETNKHMERIRLQMDSIADSMIRLSEQSQAISDIIATVDDLTQQSNLLAVNAAIEAAKAGEQGKGFAVVAQEVKNLAEQSRQATAQVRLILSDIQKATGAAVMATEQGSKAVDAGVQQSARAGDSILQLADSINEASNAATQIEASSQQQLVGMDQVALAMDSVKQASVQNVDSSRQLESAARDLIHLGQSLRDFVDRYQVADRT
jgi:methyl-accepting chemotaxis protein